MNDEIFKEFFGAAISTLHDEKYRSKVVQNQQLFQRTLKNSQQLDMPVEAQRSSEYLKEQLKLLDDRHRYDSKEISGTVTSKKRTEIEDEFDLSSKKLKKIKNSQVLFNEEKLNPNSILYRAVASMLLELNNTDENIALNEQIRYSDKINYSYEIEFKRKLLTNDDQSEELRRFVNSSEFPKYYRCGYHDIEDTNHTLQINKEFLNEFISQIYDDQKLHNFDLQPYNIKDSSNKYISMNVDHEIQRTTPLIRKSGQMHDSTNDPDFDQQLLELQAFFNNSKKQRSR